MSQQQRRYAYWSQEIEEENLERSQERGVWRLWNGFTEFALQGNIMEVAMGLILASMFTALVTSLVSDVMLPPLSVILPLNRNLEEKFAVLQPGPGFDPDKGYNTLKQAQDDGAVVLSYGVFLTRLINFFGVGLALYTIAWVYQLVSSDPIIKHTTKCRYCRKRVNKKAMRCVNSTQKLYVVA